LSAKIQLFSKNGTKSNFFVLFLPRKSWFSCIFSFSNRLKVEIALTFFINNPNIGYKSNENPAILRNFVS
ncbi:MAG: hypothetical protein IJ647_09365, partial [Prevotella sp.]|nr:hypothetical protein [Prevotella sp.]